MSIACLTVRLEDVCATLKKTSNVNISQKVTDTTYCFAGIVI